MAFIYDKKTNKSIIRLSIIFIAIFVIFFFSLRYFLDDESYDPISTTYISSFEQFAFDIDAYFYEDICVVRSIEAYHPSHYTFVSAQYRFYPLVSSDGSIVYRLYDSNSRSADDMSYMIVTFYDQKQNMQRSIIMSMEDVLDFSAQEMRLPIYVGDKTFSIHRAYLEPGGEIRFRMNSLE